MKSQHTNRQTRGQTLLTHTYTSQARDNENTSKLGAYSRWHLLPCLNVRVQKSQIEITKKALKGDCQSWNYFEELRVHGPVDSPESRYCRDPYLHGYVLYRGGCVFVLRRAMKSPTVFIGGYPSCIITEIHGPIALI